MNTSLLFLLVGIHPTAGISKDHAGSLDWADLYPYRTSSFNPFIADSYQNPSGPGKFYSWFERAYRKTHFQFSDKKNVSLTRYLQYKYKDLAATRDPEARTKKERNFSAALFSLVKKTLPHFSLDAGFEFKNAVEQGKRQCFLQSVLIAGLLQKGGVRAGVAMVNRNIEGQETNNKHAVTIVRLANGKDIIVDASEDEPFAAQQGLFVDSIAGYKFVRPVYLADDSIVAYRSYDEATVMPISEMRPLPRSFIRSQFDYYRGERTAGGVMAKEKTPEGLMKASQFLERSVAEEPQNSLAEYMLGRVDLYRDLMAPAAKVLERAMSLYARQGWVPPDERLALSQAQGNS